MLTRFCWQRNKLCQHTRNHLCCCPHNDTTRHVCTIPEPCTFMHLTHYSERIDRVVTSLVGWSLVGQSLSWIVAKGWVLGRQLLLNTNRKLYPRKSIVQFKPPSMTPNPRSVTHFWNSDAFPRVRVLSTVRPSDDVNRVRPWQVSNTHRWSLCTTLEWGTSYRRIVAVLGFSFLEPLGWRHFHLHSPLWSSITPSLFHFRLKTYLFNKSFPP